MKRGIMLALFLFWQFTWGFLQSIVGAVLFVIFSKNRHRLFHGAIMTEWDFDSSVSLGAFIFVSDKFSYIRQGLMLQDEIDRLAVHEYGHTIQSAFLGPIYLLVIGIPSAIWANLPYFEKKRRRTGQSYYDFIVENNANKLGSKFTGRPNPSSPIAKNTLTQKV